jgi:hypothetical protein
MRKPIIPLETMKRVKKIPYYSEDQFLIDARRWIRACRQQRLLCNIVKVSPSGMSRKMKFSELVKGPQGRHYHLNFMQFLKALGWRCDIDSASIHVAGAGMDMVFHVNYSVIGDLQQMGVFMTDPEQLKQRIPHLV